MKKKSNYRSQKEDQEMLDELNKKNLKLTAKGVLSFTLDEALKGKTELRAKEFDEMWDIFIKRLDFFGVSLWINPY